MSTTQNNYTAPARTCWILLILTCGLSLIPVFGFGAWIIAGPMLIASFVISIVVLSRGGTAQGIVLLLLSVIVAPVFILCAPIITTALGIGAAAATTAAAVPAVTPETSIITTPVPSVTTPSPNFDLTARVAADAPPEPPEADRQRVPSPITTTIPEPEIRQATPVADSSPILTPILPSPVAQELIQPQPTEGTRASALLRASAVDYIAAGNAPSLDDEMALYADKVAFYDQGTQSRDEIRADLAKERKKWTSRHYQLSRVIESDYNPANDEGSVVVRFTYQVSNAQKSRTGEAESLIIFQSVSKNPKVILVKEHKIP